MRYGLLLLTCVLGATLPLHAQGQPVATGDRIQRVENGLLTPVVIAGRNAGMKLTDRMAFYNVPAVSVAVIDEGRVAWARAWGTLEAGGSVPADTATLFQAASISKPVAAMAALHLVEQGRLSLDADVNSLLRSWRVPENGFTRTAPVSLRRLLSHSAGLTVHGFRGYAQGEAVPSVVQVLQGDGNSAAVRADTIPGALWRYSGGGSTVAQVLMQDVTGVPFARLARALVLEPAGMRHSGYEQPLPPDRVAAAATGHRANGSAVYGRWHTYPEMFAAGLWTTPSDLARLAISIQKSFAGATDGILSPAMTREMLRVQAGEWGLGFAVVQGSDWISFSHGGANEGFRATFLAFANSGQGAVIMTNGDAGGALAGEILRAIAREYGWPAQQAVTRSVAELPAGSLEALAGDFTGTGGATVTVTAADSVLLIVGPPFGAQPRAFHPAGVDAFFHLDSTSTLRFERDAGGNVTALILERGPQVVRMPRRRPASAPEVGAHDHAPDPIRTSPRRRRIAS
jgi:CubicO group peptidase (beta-lactamase class C family)